MTAMAGFQETGYHALGAPEGEWEAHEGEWEAHEGEWETHEGEWEAHEGEWETHEGEWEAHEGEWEAHEGEWEAHEAEWEHGEHFGQDTLAAARDWVARNWAQASQRGSWQRKAAFGAAKAGLPKIGEAIGTRYGGALGGGIGGALGAAGASLIPDQEFEAEFEYEASHELNPVRKVYLDAMLEHIGHEAAFAESEAEAVEGFLPLIPMLAGKLLPLAAKALPKLAGKIAPKLIGRAMPRIAQTVTRVAPHLSRSVSNVARTLYRNPHTRPLVRTLPSIARNTLSQISRRVATGHPVSPQAAQRLLARQTYQVLSRPALTARILRRNALLDRQYHRRLGIGLPRRHGAPGGAAGPMRAGYGAPGAVARVGPARGFACPRCGAARCGCRPRCCSCC